MSKEEEIMEYLKPLLARLEKEDRILRELKDNLRSVQEALTANTAAQAEMKKQHDEMLVTYKAFKATVKVFGFVEAACVFIAKVAAAVGLVAAAWTYTIKKTLEGLLS